MSIKAPCGLSDPWNRHKNFSVTNNHFAVIVSTYVFQNPKTSRPRDAVRSGRLRLGLLIQLRPPRPVLAVFKACIWIIVQGMYLDKWTVASILLELSTSVLFVKRSQYGGYNAVTDDCRSSFRGKIRQASFIFIKKSSFTLWNHIRLQVKF